MSVTTPSESGRDPAATVVASAIAEDVAYEQRCAEDAAWTGSRLFIGVVTFAFVSLAFAYFYLRSSNTADLWRPGHVTAPTSIGAAIFAISVATAAIYHVGSRRMRRGMVIDWEVAGWTGVAGGLLALGLQIWELTRLPFYPGSSGYASCFIGWASLNIALLFGGIYWMETLLARSLRLRRALREEGGLAGSELAPARLFRASADSAGYFWWYIALVELLFWIIFYAV